MADIINYISAHWVEIIAIALMVQTVAEKIAALTPTHWDENALKYVRSFLNFVAMTKK